MRFKESSDLVVALALGRDHVKSIIMARENETDYGYWNLIVTGQVRGCLGTPCTQAAIIHLEPSSTATATVVIPELNGLVNTTGTAVSENEGTGVDWDRGVDARAQRG